MPDDTPDGCPPTTLWPTVGEISDLVVSEPNRKRGWGTAMIQTLARRALDMGVSEIEIGAAASNPRAASLYRRLGFRESHKLNVSTEHGREEVLYLRLKLKSDASGDKWN